MGRKPSGRSPGRPPKDDDERAVKIAISLSPQRRDLLDTIALDDTVTRSHVIARWIDREAKRRKL